jgi:hypothetical protein
MVLPQLPKCTEPVAADLQIVRARLSRLLLECVKDVDRLRSRSQVEHSACTGNVNPDLTNARSDRLHRLPVVRIQSLLDAPQLETSQPSCESREFPKVTPRAAEP